MNQMKKIANFVIGLSIFYVCHSAFYAGGRSRTGHLTLTRPDRQPAPVDPTRFHLWLTV